MNKELKKIFLVLIAYSFAAGLYYNFQDFWLEANNLSIKTVSNVLSLCSLIAVGMIFLCTNLLTKKKIKKFALIVIVLKALLIFSLFMLNGSNQRFLIKFITILEYSLDVQLYASIYPMISIINMSDKNYALRDIIYCASYYFGVLLAGFLLGKTFFGVKLSYNFYPLIAIVLMIFAFIVLINTNLEKYTNDIKEGKLINNELVLVRIIKKICKDKISWVYLLYVLFNKIAYSTVIIMIIMLMQKWLNINETLGSNLNLIFGILSSIMASIVLYKLTFKNNYINLFIKFGVRIIFYALAIIFNMKFMYLIAIFYSILTLQSYTHVTDAPYVNRFNNEDQIAFCNLSEMVNYLATAIGAFLCGIAIVKNIQLIFAFALIFAIIGYVFAIYVYKLRMKATK